MVFSSNMNIYNWNDILWWWLLVAKSCPTLVTQWTVVHQAPVSMGFPRQEYWSALPFPPQGKVFYHYIFLMWQKHITQNLLQLYLSMHFRSIKYNSHCCTTMNTIFLLSFFSPWRTEPLYPKNNKYPFLPTLSPWQHQFYFLVLWIFSLISKFHIYMILRVVLIWQWFLTWQPTPVFLSGESQGPESLVGCHLWGRTESDNTEAT